MMIASNKLSTRLRSPMSAIYLLTGNEPYLFNETVQLIKDAWKNNNFTLTSDIAHKNEHQTKIDDDIYTIDTKIIDINVPNDWDLLLQIANNYSLFSACTLIDVRFSKKTLDTKGIQTLLTYLSNSNPQCLIICKAPLLPNKSIAKLTNHPQLTHVTVYALSYKEQKAWVIQQLRQRNCNFAKDVPELIINCTQNNLLAAVQLIEQITLSIDTEVMLTADLITPYLTEYSIFSLYAFVDACLNATANNIITIIRQLQYNQTDPSLLLWHITDTLRTIIAIKYSTEHQHIPIQQACQEKKIWPQRIPYYINAMQRLSFMQLYAMIKDAQTLDVCIKSNLSHILIWNMLEQISLKFHSTISLN